MAAASSIAASTLESLLFFRAFFSTFAFFLPGNLSTGSSSAGRFSAVLAARIVVAGINTGSFV